MRHFREFAKGSADTSDTYQLWEEVRKDAERTEEKDQNDHELLELEGDNDEEADELLSQSLGARDAFDRWARFLVSHFTYLHTLLKLNDADSITVELKESAPLSKELEVEPWEETINRTLDEEQRVEASQLFSYVNRILGIESKNLNEDGCAWSSCVPVAKPDKGTTYTEPPLHSYSKSLRQFLLGTSSVWRHPGTIHCSIVK